MMTSKLDEMDRMIAGEEEIIPSSGFTFSVMDAVRAEAETPRAIAFPWMRALPVFLALGVVLVLFVAGLVELARTSAFSTAPDFAFMKESVLTGNSLWIGFAVLITAASIFLPVRLASKK